MPGVNVALDKYNIYLYTADLRAEEDCGVHLPHSLFHQHCDRSVGGSYHLQDQEELSLSTRHEVSELR